MSIFKRIEDSFFSVLLFLCFFSYALSFLTIGVLVSINLWVVLILTILWCLCKCVAFFLLWKKAKPAKLFHFWKARFGLPNILLWCGAIFGFLLIWINVFISSPSTALSLNYFRKVVFYSCAFLLCPCLSSYKAPKFTYWFLFAGVSLCVAAGLMVWIFDIGEIYWGNGASKSLVLNLGNPNILGIVCSICFLWAAYCTLRSRQWWWKLISAGDAIVCFVFVLLSKSRTSLIAVIGALLIFILLKFVKIRKDRTRFFVLMTYLFLPLIVFSFYIILIKLIFPDVDVMSASTGGLFGKSWLTRWTEWTDLAKIFVQHPWFGSYYLATNGTGNSQALNLALDMMTAFGFLSYLVLIFCYFLMLNMQRQNMGGRAVPSLAALSGFLSCLLLGCFEAGIFNSSIYIFLVYSFLGFVWSPVISNKNLSPAIPYDVYSI